MWWLYITLILYLTNLTLGDQPKIIIVGAGAAGFAAASKLYENGFENITILEAENRIGGRVYTARFAEYWVDLGAQWVHGQTNNIAFELASPLGLLEVPEEDGNVFTVYDSEGRHIPDAIRNDLFDVFFNLPDGSSKDFLESNSSIGEYYTSIITTEATKFLEVNQTVVKQFTKLFESFSNVLDAADNWYNTSARGYYEFQECSGSAAVNWKDRGYGTILDVLTKKYPNPENELPVRSNTILNVEVVNVDYNSTEGKVLVESSNGEKYLADHVIMTPSLGVLKEQYETLFTPQLPESKIKTIKGLSIGVVAKIYLSFDAPWWPTENNTRFAFVWNDSDKQEYENDPQRKWLLDLFTFYTVAHKPQLLCGWIYGAGARHMETLPEDQVLNETLAILNKFLGKSYNITRPTAMLRSQWYSNKHFRGTYSSRSMESEKADVWTEGLAVPLVVNDKPIVLFAGEATHSSYYGTVHGAIESGFREADRLINMYNITTTKTNWYSNKHFRGTHSFRSMESEAADVWADGLAAPLIVNEKPVIEDDFGNK